MLIGYVLVFIFTYLAFKKPSMKKKIHDEAKLDKFEAKRREDEQQYVETAPKLVVAEKEEHLTGSCPTFNNSKLAISVLVTS